MKPVEALQAATVNAAELLRQSDQIGSIEPGKFADVIAVSGDPLADNHKDGKRRFCDEGRRDHQEYEVGAYSVRIVGCDGTAHQRSPRS